MPQIDHSGLLADIARSIEDRLDAVLPTESEHSPELVDAMRYATLGGGKRLRGTLVCATAHALTGSYYMALDCACALECLHAYSLVHDDLPVMDDADLRRGKASCHKKYDPAMATLVGDALQPLAFSLVLECDALTTDQRLAVAQTLAQAAGWRGMVGGQAWDIRLGSNPDLTVEELRRLHAAKTGEFFSAAVEIGRIVSGFTMSDSSRAHLGSFASKLGEAFQVVDDVLDASEATSTLGKPSGQDARHEKPTFPALLGLERAKQYANELIENALGDLELLGLEASALATVAKRCVQRTS